MSSDNSTVNSRAEEPNGAGVPGDLGALYRRLSDPTPAPVNVVLVTVDCLRYDRCGFNGADKDTTPVLDELATESVVYDRAIAPGPRTAESVPGILSGRLSAECTYLGELYYKSIPADAETLATWLQAAGYRTVATVSNPQLSRRRNFDRGYDSFTNLRIARSGSRKGGSAGADDENGAAGDRGARVRTAGRRALHACQNLPVPVDPAVAGTIGYRYLQRRRGWPTVDGARVVETFLEEIPAASEGPFFGWLHLNDLHSPLHPGRVRDGGLLEAGTARQFRADARRIRQQRAPLFEAMYDSTVRYVDAQIGRLLDALRGRDDWGRTVVVVTADHGEALWDRGIYGHAAGNEQRLHEDDRDYLYRELTHVPLLVRVPNGGWQGRWPRPFPLLWTHELLGRVTGIGTGQFPRGSGVIDRDGGIHSGDEVPVVGSDSLTERGHTVAVVSGERKLITDGTTPSTVDTDRWHYFSGTDRGERRGERTPPDGMVRAGKAAVTDPDDLVPMGGRVGKDTERLLRDLGYR